jgi:hypothetical protein
MRTSGERVATIFATQMRSNCVANGMTENGKTLKDGRYYPEKKG